MRNAGASTDVLARVSWKRALYAWATGTFVLGLWWSRMYTVPEYYERTYELGWYRWDGDAIAIPIAGSALATMFATPFVAVTLWLVLRRFPARVRLLAWSKRRNGSSLLWTAGCAALCYVEITNLVEAARLRLPLTFAATLSWLATWLLLRAVLVSRASVRVRATR